MDDKNEQPLASLLLQDAMAAIMRRDDPDQATRREVIRTVFASCEGMVWIFRNHVAEAAKLLDQLHDDEAAALLERQFFANDNGKITSQPRFMSISANIRLCADIANRMDASFRPDFGGHRWQNFRSVVLLRNRLSHPKSVDDLHVGDDELRNTIASFFWLVDLITDAMDSANKALREHHAEFTRLFAELEADDPVAWSEYRRALQQDDS